MEKKTLVKGVLSQDAFIMVNKKLCKVVGITAAAILGELNSIHNMCEKRIYGSDFFEGGIHGEWFYFTQPKAEEKLGIKRTELKNAIDRLINNGLIEKWYTGLPAKNHYLINWELVFEIITKPEIETEKVEKVEQTAPRTGCRKPATKGGGNLQPSEEETCTLASRKPAPIITSNNNYELELEIKEEEEEGAPESDLLKFLQSKDITKENAAIFENRLLENKIVGYSNDDILEALEFAFEAFLKRRDTENPIGEPYIYAVGRLERILAAKTKVSAKKKDKPSVNGNRREEKIPDWFVKREQRAESAQKEDPSADIAAEREKLLRELGIDNNQNGNGEEEK